MIVALDVAYGEDMARVAAVFFADWRSTTPVLERTLEVAGEPPPYQPGQFSSRELPVLQRIIQIFATLPALFIVDGYVDLGPDRPGLGRRLADWVDRPVVGVAKRAFRGAVAVPVLRGQSKDPLWVTATGISVEEAAEAVRGMAGPHRIPTLLKRADTCSRLGKGL